MSSSLSVRAIALGVMVFVGIATVRPAIAAAANDEEPSVTPAAGSGAPAPSGVQPVQPYPPPGYPPPGYPPPGYPPGYPPPGYAPYPPGYLPAQLTKVHRPRRGLVTGGAVTFGVTWGIAATISFLLNGSSCSGSCSNNADYLWIPIAGPIIVSARDSGGDTSLFFLWSAAEAAGIVMFIFGVIGHDVMEYRIAQPVPTVQLTPMFTRDASGMALTARW
ncbi:MAG TPA: hypothetical protein VN903_08345 [Polyangia bacterium]|jgi:hypothetical protein|nr:hypothetical protein [Polyangia bacterium]